MNATGLGRWLFGAFVVSGFCSLLYEVVWLRLAMAQFGVTAAMASIVLSVFMAGLAIGSWLAGRLAERASGVASLLRMYALAEFVIAVSAVAMPGLLAAGRSALSGGGGSQGVAWGSLAFHAACGVWTALVMLVPCACMGSTFPLAMGALRRMGSEPRSFSRLYVANVIGATAGTLVTAFVLIEILGFARTLRVAAALNVLLAAAAVALGRRAPQGAEGEAPAERLSTRAEPRLLAVLFGTGIISLGLEVVWIRLLTPYLGTFVYALAVILGTYLGATFLGASVYRRRARGDNEGLLGALLALLFALALLPLAATDPRLLNPDTLPFWARAVPVLAIAPYCGVVGFITSMVVDRRSGGDPRAAGEAYALNVLGCILGPLLAGFVLLPLVGERVALALLAAPLLVLAVTSVARAPAWRWTLAAAAAGGLLLVSTRDFATRYPDAVVRRDATATVVAHGAGRAKQLLINGIGITILTPITKMMSHLPLALLGRAPRHGLVICFGMGTSVKSMLAWGIETTTVELVPSVPPLAGFFHRNGDAMLASPQLRVVVDDGRRFLDRVPDTYDVIVIDPPPPVEAAGSSLLYSREFYEAARRRLAEDGILQQWIPVTPDSDPVAVAAFVLALREAFPFVRAHRSVEGWGVHLLASGRPLPRLGPEEAARRLPGKALRDLLEWGPHRDPVEQMGLLRREVPLETFTARARTATALRDDRPVNEYFLLRRVGRRLSGRATLAGK